MVLVTEIQVYLDLYVNYGQFQYTVDEIGYPQLNCEHMSPTSPLETPTKALGRSFDCEVGMTLYPSVVQIYLNLILVLNLQFMRIITKSPIFS